MKWTLEVFSAREKRYFPIEVLKYVQGAPGPPTSNSSTSLRSRVKHERVSPTGNLRKRNNDAAFGRERTNTRCENGVSPRS